MLVNAVGHLRKMQTTLNDVVDYQLPIGDQLIPMNELLDKKVTLNYSGLINCIYCDRKTNKSFNQGYCYPCFSRLAQCDSCIISPEKCHYDSGTCREPNWADNHCMTDHFVYLANSSGIKVGITRGSQIPTRWMDQGAIQAVPVFRVLTRMQSGLVETVFKNHVADKTNWRAMLKGKVDHIDIISEKNRLLDQCSEDIAKLQQRFGIQSIGLVNDADTVSIDYPVLEYPTKVVSLNFDKTPVIEGRLMGIKGQYLMFDIGVINIRKFAGYHITFSS